MNTEQSKNKSIIEELSVGLEIERQLLELTPLFCRRIKNKRYARSFRGYKERVVRNISSLESILKQLGVEPPRITLDERYYGALTKLRAAVSGESRRGNDRVLIKSLKDIEDWRVTTSNWPVMIFRLADEKPDYYFVLEPMVKEAVRLRDRLERFNGEMMTPAQHEYWRLVLVRSGMLAPKPGDKLVDDDDDGYFPIC
jgi:hypothetical protein